MSKLLCLVDSAGAGLGAQASLATFAADLCINWDSGFSICYVGSEPSAESMADLCSLGAMEVLVMADEQFARLTADAAAEAIRTLVIAEGYNILAADCSSFGRDVLPRACALLDIPMISDVIAVDATGPAPMFRRPVCAGKLIAKVEVTSTRYACTVRASAFRRERVPSGNSPVRRIDSGLDGITAGTEWVGASHVESKRPDLSNANVVVSGGRPLRDSETYERLIGGLADCLHGATGATRAAVDSGIAANDLQVGQTGKVVAPALYIAAGISGSIQHLAGMKDSKVIVAINTDPEAPIFSVADFGLVADLHTAIPELISLLS